MHDIPMNVEQVPGWLIITLQPPEDNADLAEALWSVLEQHGMYQLVLELQQLPVLRSRLVGELVRLHKRVHEKGGAIRLCGLSEANQTVLRLNRLDNRLPHFASRDAALHP